ncbi:MAG: regulatory protein RecX [Coprococcus sp.]
MLVTEIKRMDEKRYCLYLDYEPYCSLYISDIKRLELKEGDEISPDTIDAFRKEYLYKRAMNKAVASLKFSEKCEYDIRIKLKELYYDEEIIDYTVMKLKSYGYIDDMRYSCLYIRKYISKKSRKNITYELLRKDIQEDIIDEAFASQELPDELMTVSAMMNRRFSKYDIMEKKDKVMAYFLRKGFSMKIVSDCMKSVLDQ